MWILKNEAGQIVTPGMELPRPGREQATFVRIEQPPSLGKSGKVLTSSGVFYPSVFNLTFENTDWTPAERSLESMQKVLNELVKRVGAEAEAYRNEPSDDRELVLNVTRAELAAFITTWASVYSFRLELK